ncbi:MAG TPA: LON peptidase substrate-binding domain-containing protein [Candidatus Acidoferrales bacterium]|nr:LON peptidase substrate-binding domain-containing protein [Candidatus Acidoferrales bacterium]
MSERLRLFPLNTVLFPGATLHLHVFEPRYKQLIAECLDRGEAFGVCLIREGSEAEDPDVDPHEIGTTAEIGEVMPLPFGRYYVSTTGNRRFRITGIVSREPYLLCDVEYLDEPAAKSSTIDSLVDRVRAAFDEYKRLLVSYVGANAAVELPVDPVDASYVIGGALQVADLVKQRLLETSDFEQRLRVELEFLRRLLPQLRSRIERERTHPTPVRREPLGGEARSQQESYYGKFFSLN